MSGASHQWFALRVALFYGALFLVYGIHLPYLPVWLDWRGLTSTEIGVITAAPFFVRVLVTPVVGLYADQHAAQRPFIKALAWLTLAAALLLVQATGFWTILAVAVLFSLASTTIMPLVETVAVQGVRDTGLDYGRMRLWGSLAFVAASFGGGWVIGWTGAWSGAWLIAGGAVLTVAAAYALPGPSSAPRQRIAEPLPGARVSLRRLGWPRFALTGFALPSLGAARPLVRSPVFIAFLVAAGAIQGAHATFYTFGSLHWQAAGIPASMVGILWTIGVAAEIALFAWSGAVMQRVWATTLMLIGAGAAVVRWTAMAFDPPLALLIPLQVLHGATYGATHVGAIHFLSRAVPHTASATAQALYATVAAGVGMGAATLASGWLYAAFAGRAYLGMALVALAGLAAVLYLRRAWSGGLIWEPGQTAGEGSGASAAGATRTS